MKETNCQAVKLEGGAGYADRVRAVVDAGIPVVGHIGLTPQSFNTLGGYKVQGKTVQAARQLLDDAHALEEAGAFAITLECVPERSTPTFMIPCSKRSVVIKRNVSRRLSPPKSIRSALMKTCWRNYIDNYCLMKNRPVVVGW